jgi:hypothetical protein
VRLRLESGCESCVQAKAGMGFREFVLRLSIETIRPSVRTRVRYDMTTKRADLMNVRRGLGLVD